jgi:hypothetical protein
MQWYLILKNTEKQPDKGTYSDWKPIVAEECFYQCVYCAIHESQFGGIVNYHIDHFRPKSLFAALINDLANLYYACPICNRFKSDDWPDEPSLDKVSYPEPCKVDYNTLFEFDDKYSLIGLFTASKYLIHRLYLNRAQLIFERRETAMRKKVGQLITEIQAMIGQLADADLKDAYATLSKIDSVKNNLIGLDEVRRKVRPYVTGDIKKS